MNRFSWFYSNRNITNLYIFCELFSQYKKLCHTFDKTNCWLLSLRTLTLGSIEKDCFNKRSTMKLSLWKQDTMFSKVKLLCNWIRRQVFDRKAIELATVAFSVASEHLRSNLPKKPNQFDWTKDYVNTIQSAKKKWWKIR